MIIYEIIDKLHQDEHLTYVASLEDASLLINYFQQTGWPGHEEPVHPCTIKKEIFGLKSIRQYRGLSQRELANMSGVNFRSIQDYEQEKRSIMKANISTVMLLSKALQVPMEDLLCHKESLNSDFSLKEVMFQQYLERFTKQISENGNSDLKLFIPVFIQQMINEKQLDETALMHIVATLLSSTNYNVSNNIDILKGGTLK